MNYVIPILLVLLTARIGRFLASTGSNRPEYWNKTWRCDSITEHGGPICSRIRGHWGWHHTAALGALGWYEEWQGDGEQVFVVGLGDRFVRSNYQGRGI